MTAEYLCIFSSNKKKEELFIKTADFNDFKVFNKHCISFNNQCFACSLTKHCHINAVHVHNRKCSYWETERLSPGIEVVGNYSISIQEYPYEEGDETCVTITRLINHYLKETEGDFCFVNISGAEIILRTNGNIYIDADYTESHLIKLSDIENVDYFIKRV